MENTPSSANSFWRKIDHQGLIHKPVLWSTRLHRVVPLVLGAGAVLFLLFYLFATDPRNDSKTYVGVVLLSIVSLIGFVFWMIFLLRFNVFKRFGNWTTLDSLWHFLAYFLIVLLLTAFPIIPRVTESIRASQAYSTSELVNDINLINEKICLLERDSLDLTFESDTFHWRQGIIGREDRRVYIDSLEYERITPHYSYVDSASFAYSMANSDSTVRIGDSVVVVFECPDFQWVYGYQIDDVSGLSVMSSMELYRRFLARKKDIDRKAATKVLFERIRKYDPSNPGHPYSPEETPGVYSTSSSPSAKYDVGAVQAALNNISEKKYRWDNGAIAFTLRFLYYFSLGLSMLVFIFRHSTRRTFFLSLLTALILTILTGLFMSVGRSSFSNFLGWMFFYFLLFSFLAGIIFFQKNRSVVNGIALNLGVYMVPLMPLFVVAFYYEQLHDQYRRLPYDPLINEALIFQHEKLHYHMAEIVGFLLLLVLIPLVIGKLYKRWYSLPEH